jgi:two-component system NtrC family response regulator
MSGKHILLVDDDHSVAEALSFSLASLDFEVTVAHDVSSARATLERNSEFDLVITDLRMPGESGLKLVEFLHHREGGPAVVVLTAHGNVDTAVEAMKLGAVDFLEKPISRETLKLTLARAFRNRALAWENQDLKKKLKATGDARRIIATSLVMSALLDTVDRIADTDATVLLQGESGTGKELLASRIHHHSSRASGPFVAVNCSALPSSLLESELFGHAKGAFTGATRSRSGKFVDANGGTLFLDEIGEMHADLQAKLLRVLQERVVDVVGGQSRKLDVRVIAATNANLDAMRADGRFRDDLFYRLSVLPIRIPPLRERREDIPVLFEHFVRVISAQEGRPAPVLAADLHAELIRRDWPGNVRELQNVATRMVLLSTSDRLTQKEFTLFEGPGKPPSPSKENANPTPESGIIAAGAELRLPNEGTSLEELERAAVLAALSACGGNRTRAAKFLRVPRHVLIYRIEKFKITHEEIPDVAGEPRALIRTL